MQTLVPWQGSPEWSFQIFPHHVVQRGMRRMDVFFSADDRQELPRSESASKHALDFRLMSNHAHLVGVPRQERLLARTFGEAHRRYTRMVNFREGWRGPLWQERFHSYPMDERRANENIWAYLFCVAPAFRIIAAHFAASASDSNPKTAEYFFPTTWATRKSRLIPASAMACAVA